MNRLTPIFIFTLAVIQSVFPFVWEDCGAGKNPIKLQKLYVADQNGLFYISLKAAVEKNITEPVQGKLTIQKKIPVLDVYVDIPCIDNVGSCEYNDVCKLSPWINTACPPDFLQNDLPCKCPVQTNQYAANQLQLDLRKYANIIEGTYKVKIVLYKGGEELFCVKVKIAI